MKNLAGLSSTDLTGVRFEREDQSSCGLASVTHSCLLVRCSVAGDRLDVSGSRAQRASRSHERHADGGLAVHNTPICNRNGCILTYPGRRGLPCRLSKTSFKGVRLLTRHLGPQLSLGLKPVLLILAWFAAALDPDLMCTLRDLLVRGLRASRGNSRLGAGGAGRHGRSTAGAKVDIACRDRISCGLGLSHSRPPYACNEHPYILAPARRLYEIPHRIPGDYPCQFTYYGTDRSFVRFLPVNGRSHSTRSPKHSCVR